jgi:flagellar biosynthetic protein FliQ
MNPDLAIELFKLTVFKAVLVVAPFLLTALVVGLAISLFQSITSLQEQTLVFVPKLVALVAVFLVAAPWVVRSVTEFAIANITRMAEIAR